MRRLAIPERFALVGAIVIGTGCASSWWLWAAGGPEPISRLAASDRSSPQLAPEVDATAALLHCEYEMLRRHAAGTDEVDRSALQRLRHDWAQLHRSLSAIPALAEVRACDQAYAAAAARFRTMGDAVLAGPPNAAQEHAARLQQALAEAQSAARRLAAASALAGQGSAPQPDSRGLGVRERTSLVALGLPALFLAALAWLAHGILVPLRRLTQAIAHPRQADGGWASIPPECGGIPDLAAAFQRMATELRSMHQSTMGDLFRATTTMEATIAAITDPILLVDAEGRVRAGNPLGQEVLAAAGAEDGIRLAQLALPHHDRLGIEGALAGRKFQNPATAPDLLWQLSIHGNIRSFQVNAAPIPDATPGRFGAVVMLNDLSAFVRLDAMRSELIAVAAHELRSPLTALRVTLLLLHEEQARLTSRQAELVRAALTGCEELYQTAEELLDFTQIEAGALRLRSAPFDARAMLSDAVRRLEARILDQGMQLVTELGDGAPAIMTGDVDRLRRVITNLLDNALRYGRRPGGTIRLALESTGKGDSAADPQGTAWRIQVMDDGPGIPASFRTKVFEKFSRLPLWSPQAGAAPRGTGLGLYLCRQIVLAHRGDITCAAGAAGVGTRIIVTLPSAGPPT